MVWLQLAEWIKKRPSNARKEFITKPYKLEKDTHIEEKIKSGSELHVPSTIRFRYEEDENFYLMNIRWGNTIEVTKQEGEFFIEMQKKNNKFSLKDCKFENALERFTGFIAKEALKSDEII